MFQMIMSISLKEIGKNNLMDESLRAKWFLNGIIKVMNMFVLQVLRKQHCIKELMKLKLQFLQ